MKRYRDHKTDVLGGRLNEQLEQAVGGGALSDEELFSFAGFDAGAAERGGYSNYSYWGATVRAFLQNRTAVFFLCLMALVLAFTFIQPYLPNQRDPLLVHNNDWGLPLNNVPPGEEFWFGTNAIGQDLWARIWAGTRTSLFIGFSVAVVEAVVGILVGMLWGYVRKLDFFFTELYNVLDNIPQTLLLILISYVLKPGVSTIIFALSLTGWLGMARFIRNQIIIIRDREYNLASRCLGTSIGRIAIRNILPFMTSVIVTMAATEIPSYISYEVFLSYIGIGLKEMSLGRLIFEAEPAMVTSGWQFEFWSPVVVASIIAVVLYVVGQNLGDASDPRTHM